MKRDMGLIRDLLLKLEALEKTTHDFSTIYSCEPELAVEGYDADQIDYHMTLLYEAGLITSGGDMTMMMDGAWIFRRLTWAGHDFVETVRDVKRRWNGTPDRRAIGTPSQAGCGAVRLS